MNGLKQWKSYQMNGVVGSVPSIGINSDISSLTMKLTYPWHRLPFISFSYLGGYSAMPYSFPFLANISLVSFLGALITEWLLGT